MKFGALLAVGVLLVIIVWALFRNSTMIDPTQYLSEPVFSGVNTMGKAEVKFDEEALIESIIGEAPEDAADFWEWAEKYENYSDNIRCDYTSGKLSNGDEFTVTISATGIAAEKINGVTCTYIVEGLAELKTIDVFQYITVEFSGVSGDAKAELTVNTEDPYVNACRFTVEPSSGLKNGDVVTVTIANAEQLINLHNTVPAESAKIFTVNGLIGYVTVDSLPMNIVHEMAQRFAAEQQAKNDNEGIARYTYSDVEICGIYFAEKMEGTYGKTVNALHILVSYDFFIEGKYQRTTYMPYTFKNLTVNSDGTVDIIYENGSSGAFSYTKLESFLNKISDGFIVTQVE